MRKKLNKPRKPEWMEDGQLHHVFNGPYRSASDEWGCVVWLTANIHAEIHNNAEARREMKAIWQKRLEAAGWTREEFRETFGKSYL